MKVKTYSQWAEEVYVPVRSKQFVKAAKLLGRQNFSGVAAGDDRVGRGRRTAKFSRQQAVAE